MSFKFPRAQFHINLANQYPLSIRRVDVPLAPQRNAALGSIFWWLMYFAASQYPRWTFIVNTIGNSTDEPLDIT